MIYRNLCGNEVSMFGMGCMRLPKTDPKNDATIDVEQTKNMVAYAIEHGCNYFDTAWGYHMGKSEEVIGECLSAYPRNSFYLASKFPGYDSNNWGKQADIFPKQLKKCGVDYFDYYLIHNVCEMNIDAYTNEERYGTKQYYVKQLEEGRIKHLGFSVHGSYNVMQRFLDMWADVIEFVQIQLNYIDYTFQDAKAKLELANTYKLPIIVMEPLRGGMLAKATDEEGKLLRHANANKHIVEWAFHYLQGFEQVACVLCGSSSLEQLKENMSYFNELQTLTPEEETVLQSIVAKRIDQKIMPCTACNYCASYCPQSIDIPAMIALYNEHAFTGGGFLAPMRINSIPKGQRPQDCTACNSCAEVCPQHIAIPELFARLTEQLKNNGMWSIED